MKDKFGIPQDGTAYRADFWSSDQYKSYEDAQESGAISHGETCYSYDSFITAMTNCCAAVDRLCHEAHVDDIHAYIFIAMSDGTMVQLDRPLCQCSSDA